MINRMGLGTLVVIGLAILSLTFVFAFKYYPPASVEYTDELTILLPTYNRDLKLVNKIIAAYEKMPIVKTVLVLEFDTGHKTNHPNAIQLPNDLRHRFGPERFESVVGKVCPYVDTYAVMTVDDDVILSNSLLCSLLSRLKEEPSALHGIEGRNIIDGKYQSVSRPSLQRGGSQVSMLLTWCAMGTTEKFTEVESEFRSKYFDFAHPLNGEDIAFSKVYKNCYMHEFGWLCWFGLPVMNTEINFMTSESSLSNNPRFVEERQKIANRFHAVNLKKSKF